MILTVYQRYMLDCLKEIPYIRQRHLLWLMRLKFGSTETQVQHDLQRLKRLKAIALHGEQDAFVSLPKQKWDAQLLSAADIMAEVCGNNLPEFMQGEPPCKLHFFIRDEQGYLDFMVVPVSLGEEHLVLERLRRKNTGFVCTYLFLLEHREQIERLSTGNPAYYVFRNTDGSYDFLKKQ